MGSSQATFIKSSLSAMPAEQCWVIILLPFPGQQMVFFLSLYKDRVIGIQIPKPQ